MKKKYYIETQGCQMNEYDSDKMKWPNLSRMDIVEPHKFKQGSVTMLKKDKK